MQLSLNMKKYNQAIFNNFRRNRGSIYVRYHVMLNGQWYPVDNKIAIMPKCIYTMPPIDVRVDFKNSWVFEAFDKHELLAEHIKQQTLTGLGEIHYAVKQEGIEVMEFVATLYSDLDDASTLFIGLHNTPGEFHVRFDCGRGVLRPYHYRVQYSDLMRHLESRMPNDPLMLTSEELRKMKACKAALAANPSV